MKLTEDNLEQNPINIFDRWFQQAIQSDIIEPSAMTLATADHSGQPSARMVLLREYNDEGFVFFTNFHSQKGNEISENPVAALVLWWSELSRQIRIEGQIIKIPDRDSDEYFASRPPGHRIEALASNQSQIVLGYQELQDRYKAYENAFVGQEIPRPANWGGFCVVPDLIEFWQQRENRMHDRIRYKRNRNKFWVVERLSP